MAVEERPELVGKRFLCVSGLDLVELAEIARWRWRAGVIRAVTHRDSDNPELMVYVEFDGLEWERREWVKVREGHRVFLLEKGLVWAWRKDTTQLQGSKVKQIQWPALTFKPLVGKSVLGPVTAVEFLCDRRVDFLTEDGAYWPYEEEAAILNPVLRDNLQLHQEVCAWVKEQKTQDIFMRGPYSLNGHRVRVYRQDSATQWFSGIITHHDLGSRAMIVMNDQVLEPQNVDPSTVQMTFLDDIVHSLLKGEKIGIASRRRTRTSQNGSSVPAHPTRTQASSPRALSTSGSTPQAQPSPGGKDPSAIRSEAMVNKRRKPEEDRGDVKRRKAEDGCGRAESGQSESRKGTGASEPRPEGEELSQSAEGPDGEEQSQSAEGLEEEEAAPGEGKETGTETLPSDGPALGGAKTPPAPQHPIGGNSETQEQECGAGMKGSSKPLSAEHSGNVMPVMPPDALDAAEGSGRPQEGSGAASAPQPSQEAEQHTAETWPASDCRSTERKPQLRDSLSEETAPPSSSQQSPAATPCVPNPSFPQEVRTPYKQSSSPDIPRPRPSPGLALSNGVSKRDPSPGEKQRGRRANGSAAPEGSGGEPDEPHPVFKPIALRGSASEPPSSPLQPFTVYRDPALRRPPTEPGHYLHPLHPLHQPPRSGPHPGLLHHPHLLPSLLPGLAPPSMLGAVGLAHHPHHQQPPGPAGPSYNHLGLYPIVWQYPALGLPGAKWGHPESSVSSETCLRRNTASPWLPQHTPVSSPDTLGFLSHAPEGLRSLSHAPEALRSLSHAPARPASADPQPRSSPSLSNSTPEKSGFGEPPRAFTPTHPAPDTDSMWPLGAREGHHQRHFLDPLPGQQRAPQGPVDRASMYKEESRRILQESIQVAPYTAKIRPGEGEREPYLALPPPTPPLAKSHALYRDLDPAPSEMYGLKPHSVPQCGGGVFPCLSNGEARQAYPSPPPPAPLFSSRAQSDHPSPVTRPVEMAERLSLSDPLRCMPALHRAPVFHPPPPHTQHALGHPEGRAARLSPPTLTPVHAVSSAGPGPAVGPVPEQQRPPTLIPEGRGGSLPGGALEHASLRNGTQCGAACPPAAPPNGVCNPSSVDPPSTAADPGQSGGTSAREKAEGAARPQEALPPSPSAQLPQGLLHPGHIVHLKKRKAVLAAAQLQMANPTQNSANALPPLPPPISHANGVTSASSLTNGKPTPPSSLTNGKPALPSSLTNGQWAPHNSIISLTNDQPAPPSRPNYHKLKKAWLTRHSEEDRNGSAAGKPETKPSALSLTASTPAGPDSSDQEVRHGQDVGEKKVGENKESREKEDVREKKVGENKESREKEDVREKKVGENKESREKEDVREKEEVRDKQDNREVPDVGDDPVAREEQGEGKPQRAAKRSYKSTSESTEESDGSQSEHRAKRLAKPTYKKKQSDLRKRRSNNRKEEEEEPRANGVFRSAKEKNRLKLAGSNGVPRSVLKDWRRVRKLKQTGEPFLQDDSCSQATPSLQKCRECRLARSRKEEEPGHSPVFCRFYYFRRLSYSKNGAVRVDGFSSPDQYDDEAISMWAPGVCEQNKLDVETAKYILSCIGDKFCQIAMSEITAATCIKKNVSLAWKRAVRGVREMCDVCEATLFNLHWVCQKCGFVVCVDCYRTKERKASKEKDQYPWLKCVKGQPHDPKHLMPTQIIPGTVLADLLNTMHALRERFGIRAHCACSVKLSTIPSTNGVSQVLQNVLNHSNKMSLCKPPGCQEDPSLKAESDCKPAPPEAQSPLHFLADLAEQTSRQEKKENKESAVGVVAVVKEAEQGEGVEVQSAKPSILGPSSTEQGSTLRDLLTTTAGKLRLGNTEASMAFSPVYCSLTQTSKSSRCMPNILDDIIASVVENRIPAGRPSRPKPKQEGAEEARAEPKKPDAEDPAPTAPSDAPHTWLCDKRLLWLRDLHHPGNCKLFRESWELGQPVVVSGIQKKLKASLWKAESFSREFADHQGDLVNCRDGAVSVSGVKEFWDGFEDLTRWRGKGSEAPVYRLKDWPSGEEFMALMPSRYDDLMTNLPLPEYSTQEGSLNLASWLPPFFVRPDLGPRLCCAYGIVASQEQDFGTSNIHLEVSDTISILVYVGVAKGNGVLSKTGLLKRLEEEDLDEGMKRRLRDSSEMPGALWHIYPSKDTDKIKEFLHKVAREQGDEELLEQDPMGEPGRYLSRALRDRLQEEQGVQGWTLLQFHGDSVLIPAGALHQVQNLHSCVQVISDFVSPEHAVHSFHLTQELRSSCQELNYEDKLQIKNIFYHSVKEAVGTLKRSGAEEPGQAPA
ncbi:hypothetical protein COCON_G00221610 [Conger conger]|uniref:Probable JmjC domain-containing histone demethylation protein 2C n=1 Tax=Conger conger TaxID=82655 RepID=A0A9Q1CW49_CONCO|nr:hypothetical protein COCON_G00221610 [Conger conger]